MTAPFNNQWHRQLDRDQDEKCDRAFLCVAKWLAIYAVGTAILAVAAMGRLQ